MLALSPKAFNLLDRRFQRPEFRLSMKNKIKRMNFVLNDNDPN